MRLLRHVIISNAIVPVVAFAMMLNAACAIAGNLADTASRPAISITLFTGTKAGPDSSSFTIPFSRAGNLILVRAQADTIEGNFILDTGCPHVVLNETYFRHFPTTQNHEVEKKGATGTVYSDAQAEVRSFSFGSIVLNRINADLVNLGHIENSKGVKILGLVGMEVLRQCEVIIDYEKSLIYVHVISRKESSKYRHAMLDDTSAYHIVPIQLTDNRILVQTEIGGKKIKLVIDSGAESNILDSRLPDKVFENVAINGRVIINGVGNKKVDALTGDLNTLLLGKQTILALPVVIANLEKTCFSYAGCVDGILGFDFLSLQKIGFNFVNRKMYIWK